jgi:hypothetical protein
VVQEKSRLFSPSPSYSKKKVRIFAPPHPFFKKKLVGFSHPTLKITNLMYFTTLFLNLKYRKLPHKNNGDTLKGPSGTVLVTAHWVF